MTMTWRALLEETWGLFSVAWVWLHVYLIFMFERVLIYEHSRLIITVELVITTVFLVLWIVRLLRFLRGK